MLLLSLLQPDFKPSISCPSVPSLHLPRLSHGQCSTVPAPPLQQQAMQEAGAVCVMASTCCKFGLQAALPLLLPAATTPVQVTRRLQSFWVSLCW